MTIRPSDPDPDGDLVFPEDDERDLASVVRVGREEDVAAVCGRIDTSPTIAVVVHAPDGNRSLSSELGIRRLKRHAEEAGKVVAIATPSVQLASRARQAGIPVARRPEQVRWDAGGYRVFRLFGINLRIPSFGRYVQYLLLAAAVLAIAAVALAVGPSATIEVTPPTETLERLVTITADSSADEVNTTALVVPASKVSVRTSYTLAVKTTGKVNTPVRSAKVAVTISNPSAAAVTVPASTVLLTSNAAVTFALDADATVPARGTLNINATALQKGTQTNVAAAALKSFQDERYSGLTVANAAVASGGASEDRPAVDAADILAIRSLAREVEKSETVRQALLKARPRDAVFLQTAETSVELGEPSPAVGIEATVLTLDVNITVTAQAVLADRLEQVARAVLLDSQGEGTFIPGSVTAVESGASQVDAEAGTVRTQLRLRGEFARGITEEAIREAVKGKSKEDAQSTLLSRYGIQESKVSVSPGWAPRLPRATFRLNIELKNRKAEDTRETQPPVNAPTGTTTPVASATPPRP